jgi:hypothetical protein
MISSDSSGSTSPTTMTFNSPGPLSDVSHEPILSIRRLAKTFASTPAAFQAFNKELGSLKVLLKLFICLLR